MGVGVAGVKIAEVSISMGWEVMLTQFAAGGIGYLLGAIAFLLFLGIQAFAIALGLLSQAFTLPVSTLWNGWANSTTAPGSPSPPWADEASMWRGHDSPTGHTEVVNMNKTLKNTLRTMIVLAAITLIAQGVAAEGDATTATGNTITGDLGVGIALGLAAIGAGFSQAAIGSAAVGMLAEDG